MGFTRSQPFISAILNLCSHVLTLSRLSDCKWLLSLSILFGRFGHIVAVTNDSTYVGNDH